MKYAARSDVGKVRSQNEDAWSVIPGPGGHPAGFAVADGMGGHEAGEVASRMAIDAIAEAIGRCAADRLESGEAEAVLRAGVESANLRILHYSRDQLGGIPSGTTLTAGLLSGRTLLLVHIGDSRAYLFRDGVIRQLSRDHTYVAELVSSGLIRPEEAHTHPERNKITRALGFEPGLAPDILRTSLREDDQLLLCTDGLTEYVGEEEMSAVLSREDPESAAERLVTTANERGGRDNTTVVIARIGPGDLRQTDGPDGYRGEQA